MKRTSRPTATTQRGTGMFDGYEAIRQEIHDLNISISGDIAFTSVLIRAGGTLKNGHEVELWVRVRPVAANGQITRG